ncbi:MAG TPA: hypothetical protein DDW19_01785 [Anaerolineaceae bacterium]|nr:hypothetical protein [Anaerolineaceae bacterium]
MKYIINSLEPYSDSPIPKIGIDTSAYSDDGVLLMTRMIVIPLDILKPSIDLKDATASLLALVEKFAQQDKEMNLDNLKLLDEKRVAKEKARLEAQAFADLINEAIVLAKPDVITADKYSVELLPIKVRPPVIEPIEEIIDTPIIKEVLK